MEEKEIMKVKLEKLVRGTLGRQRRGGDRITGSYPLNVKVKYDAKT